MAASAQPKSGTKPRPRARTSRPPRAQRARRHRSTPRPKPGDQLELTYRSHGGKRPGAGRPRKKGRRNTPHRARPDHKARYPVHVTLRARREVQFLRTQVVFKQIRAALALASRQPDLFRLTQFSVQDDHVHAMVEAADKNALSRGMRGLVIRLARAINRALGTRGSVWADRWHGQTLTTPRQVKNALVYVLFNIFKHGSWCRRFAPTSNIDPRSSAPYFEALGARAPPGECPVVPARTWLANVGWKQHGPIRAADLRALVGA